MLIVNNISAADVTILGQLISASQAFTVPANQERIWLNDPGLLFQIIQGNVDVGDGFNVFSGSNAVAQVQFQSTLALSPAYRGSYVLPMDIIPTLGNLASGTSYWAMRNNTSGNRMFIKKIMLQSEFTGIAATSNSKFGFFRFTTATPTGGQALSAVPVDNLSPATNLLDARRGNSGLNITGLSVEATAVLPFAMLNQILLIPPFNLVDDNLQEAECICLNPGDGLILQSTTPVALGIGLHGYVQYDERT